MNKKMREILVEIDTKSAEARTLLDGGETEKAVEALNAVDELKKAYAAEERLFNLAKEAETKTAPETSKNGIAEFAKAARTGFTKAMNETVGEDGGYTVPQDIDTLIREKKTAKASLLDLVTVTPVKTNSGARTYKKRANQTGFYSVAEKGKIGKKAIPQFERVNYNIQKYAGYYALTNEVLNDSDNNLTNVITSWIGDESRCTANRLILEALAKKTAVEFDGFDGIKKAVNVTLGQAFKATSAIITNDDGLNYLDTLKDADGRYLLQPMPADNANRFNGNLVIGGTVVPVKVIPNSDMASEGVYALTTDTKINAAKTYYVVDGTGYAVVAKPVVADIAKYYEMTAAKIPFVIGDIGEGVEFFQRAGITIVPSTTAVVGTGDDAFNAFEEDLTLFRAIEREDVQVKDDAAFVNGYILAK